jgi:translation elongation factor EF-1alpha
LERSRKRGGITIELGYANSELAEVVRFGIVDVPGHERFVRAGETGAGGMDLVLPAIAADEGDLPHFGATGADCWELSLTAPTTVSRVCVIERRDNRRSRDRASVGTGIAALPPPG